MKWTLAVTARRFLATAAATCTAFTIIKPPVTVPPAAVQRRPALEMKPGELQAIRVQHRQEPQADDAGTAAGGDNAAPKAAAETSSAADGVEPASAAAGEGAEQTTTAQEDPGSASSAASASSAGIPSAAEGAAAAAADQLVPEGGLVPGIKDLDMAKDPESSAGGEATDDSDGGTKAEEAADTIEDSTSSGTTNSTAAEPVEDEVLPPTPHPTPAEEEVATDAIPGAGGEAADTTTSSEGATTGVPGEEGADNGTTQTTPTDSSTSTSSGDSSVGTGTASAGTTTGETAAGGASASSSAEEVTPASSASAAAPSGSSQPMPIGKTPSCDVFKGVPVGTGPANDRFVDPVTHYSNRFGAYLFPYKERVHADYYPVYRCCPQLYTNKGVAHRVNCGGPDCTPFYGCAWDACPADPAHAIPEGRCAPENAERRVCGQYPPPCVITSWPPPGRCGAFFSDQSCAAFLHHNNAKLRVDAADVSCAGGACTFEDAATCCEAPCPPGHFGDKCAPCERGTFSRDGGPACTPCPEGSSTLAIGAGSEAECDVCAAGYGLAPGERRHCTRCEPGTYSVGGTAQECHVCPRNFVTKKSGATSADECTVCAPGFGGDDCSPCPIGTYNSGTGAECKPCPKRFSTPHSGATDLSQCTACAPGHFGADCAPCELGTFSRGGVVPRCQPCRTGFSTKKTGSVECDICTKGRGGTECTYCEAGTYSDLQKCVACPDGFTSMRGSTAKEFCLRSCGASKDCAEKESESSFCWSGTCHDTKDHAECQLDDVLCHPTVEGNLWKGSDLYSNEHFYCPRFDCGGYHAAPKAPFSQGTSPMLIRRNKEENYTPSDHSTVAHQTAAAETVEGAAALPAIHRTHNIEEPVAAADVFTAERSKGPPVPVDTTRGAGAQPGREDSPRHIGLEPLPTEVPPIPAAFQAKQEGEGTNLVPPTTRTARAGISDSGDEQNAIEQTLPAVKLEEAGGKVSTRKAQEAANAQQLASKSEKLKTRKSSLGAEQTPGPHPQKKVLHQTKTEGSAKDVAQDKSPLSFQAENQRNRNEKPSFTDTIKNEETLVPRRATEEKKTAVGTPPPPQSKDPIAPSHRSLHLEVLTTERTNTAVTQDEAEKQKHKLDGKRPPIDTSRAEAKSLSAVKTAGEQLPAAHDESNSEETSNQEGEKVSRPLKVSVNFPRLSNEPKKAMDFAAPRPETKAQRSEEHHEQAEHDAGATDVVDMMAREKEHHMQEQQRSDTEPISFPGFDDTTSSSANRAASDDSEEEEESSENFSDEEATSGNFDGATPKLVGGSDGPGRRDEKENSGSGEEEQSEERTASGEDQDEDASTPPGASASPSALAQSRKETSAAIENRSSSHVVAPQPIETHAPDGNSVRRAPPSGSREKEAKSVNFEIATTKTRSSRPSTARKTTTTKGLSPSEQVAERLSKKVLTKILFQENNSDENKLLVEKRRTSRTKSESRGGKEDHRVAPEAQRKEHRSTGVFSPSQTPQRQKSPGERTSTHN
ncbi:unnamed protein product [Amoebophrya sp. A120]|nr:unnamed protein product [Amoebophrya sp. A120]|eukprot:GSA120T00002948001.1